MLKKVIGKIIEANKMFDLIKDGDRIAVGVSGGKDSIALLYALHTYKAYAGIKFEVIGITLKLGFPNMDFEPIINFCRDVGIEYHLVPTDVYEILQNNVDKHGRIQCSLCSKFKKAMLIDAAKRYQCNKVSMAHHYDDAIETLFMNMIYNGYLETFKPKMYLDHSEIEFIRPLITCCEKLVEKTVRKCELPLVLSQCPNDKQTSRENVKQWLRKDVYKKFPTAELNFKNMLFKDDNLWNKKNQPK